jgi:hypothetical protein
MVVNYTDEQLFDMADVVVLASVWRREAVDDGQTLPHTNYEIEAVDCFKGCQKGAWLIARSPGHTARDEFGHRVTVSGSVELATGDRVITYLKRMPNGDLVPISLGLSVFRLHYQPVLKRYIARRLIKGLSLVTPGREAQPDVESSPDRFAMDVVDSIRQLAVARGAK